MKTAYFLLVVTGLALVPAAPLRAADAEDAVTRDRSDDLLADMDCSARKARLFYDYLSGKVPMAVPYKFGCAKGKEKIMAPAWLAAEVSSMTAREIASGKDKFTEAQLWQEPLSVLADYAAMVRKTAPLKSGGLGLPQKFLAGNCQALLVRLDRAVAALRRAKLAGSFGGRGDLVFSSFQRALADLDALEQAYYLGSQATFYERSAGVVKNAEDAFAALFTDAPAEAPAGGEFSAVYYMAPRLLEGQRAVSLSFPAYKLEGIKRGDRVDLMVTYEYAAAAGKDIITATIIQAAPVLSVAAKPADASAETKGSVRLLLSPVQAQYAALAAMQGKELDLAVRSDGDAEPRPLEAANFKKIIK